MLTRDTPAASDALRGRGSTGTGERRRSPPAEDQFLIRTDAAARLAGKETERIHDPV
jgi:hypothetical protein